MSKEKTKIVRYYVQTRKNEKSLPEIVYHTKNDKTKEYWHEFINKAQAVELMNDEKKAHPDEQFRVVKIETGYSSDGWI